MRQLAAFTVSIASLAACAGRPIAIKDPPPAALFQDDFDDGEPTTNVRGRGGPWKSFAIADATAREHAGRLAVGLGTQHASYALLAGDHGSVDFWSSDGVVAELVIEEMTVRTPHSYQAFNALAWQFGFISGDHPGRDLPWLGSWLKEGAIWFTLGRKDASDAASFRVWAYNKTLVPDGNVHPAPGIPGCARPVSFDFKVTYPVTIRVRLSKRGWGFDLPGQDIGQRRTSFNWSSDMGTAPISSEFARGARLLLHARVLGVTGGVPPKAPLAGGPNSTTLERVTVRPAGTAGL